MATSRDSRLQPTVIHPIELATFIQYLLERHTQPTNLIVCASQEAFLKQLLASTEHEKDAERQEAENEELDSNKVSRIAARPHALLVPTIHQLWTSRTINVTFCATLPQLQASLAVHGIRDRTVLGEGKGGNTRSATPTLALVNPLQLHYGTSSFSAQGLSRTFASAVEAAVRTSQKLLIVECPARHIVDESAELGETREEDEDMEISRGLRRREGDNEDLWEQHVAILNVTTKSFGAGERGWVGRTVKVRRVVERWCVFQNQSLEMF